MRKKHNFGIELRLLFILIGLGLIRTQSVQAANPSFSCESVTEIPKLECEALAALYESTDGDNWSNNNGWLSTNTPCSWFGVECVSNTVHELNLNDNQLSGNLPAELGSLSNLRQIRLYNNNLTGNIPPQLGNLTYLIDLRLQFNQLTGTIPDELGNLSYLWMLWLSDNQLSGGIPSSLGNLGNLRWLFLWNNQLSGNIPPELGSLVNLEQIQLAYNELTGNIPRQVGQLASLETIYLNGNQLTGSIPVELGNLSNLQILALPTNQLSGPIPGVLGNLSNLQTLSLHSNQLSGSVPSELGNLSNLQRLLVNNNPSLSGALPDELTNLTTLNTFYFNSTSLCEPGADVFQTWLNSINDILRTGEICTGPPTADAGGPYLVAVNSSINLNGTGSDPDQDPLTFSWVASSGSFDGPNVEDPLYTAGNEAGVFDLTLTVEDTDGLSDSDTTMMVVYDPEGGFVTGGGWIWSPEGAYSPDLSLTGKATFGFVSKYKMGADTPTGVTEFQFKVADLNFHSDTYDWLVVAGARAQFKGSGTINGTGNYGFMLTAVDVDLTPSTDVDLFRIKIWDKENNLVIYDNQMGEADDSDPAIWLGGGSIKIHKGK